MEITTRPRVRRWRRTSVLLSRCAVALAVGLLLPASLGMSPQVVSDDAMGGQLVRGALGFERPVLAADQLEVGDVITFPRPGSASGERVTRRVVGFDADGVLTRGDAGSDPDPWVLEVDTAGSTGRVIFALPLVGYPQLLAAWLTWGVMAGAVGLAALLALLAAKRESVRDRDVLLRRADQVEIAPV